MVFVGIIDYNKYVIKLILLLCHKLNLIALTET